MKKTKAIYVADYATCCDGRQWDHWADAVTMADFLDCVVNPADVECRIRIYEQLPGRRAYLCTLTDPKEARAMVNRLNGLHGHLNRIKQVWAEGRESWARFFNQRPARLPALPILSVEFTTKS